MNAPTALHRGDVRSPQASSVLLVIAGAEEVSRHIESFLRNAGHPMRTEWAASLPEIEGFLAAGAPDLVLVSVNTPNLPLNGAIGIFRSFDPELPVLALVGEDQAPAPLALFKAGVRDVVHNDSNDGLTHLAYVCAREIDNYARRRDLRRMQARLQAFESRHQQLVQTTVDAIVQVQEGIIVHVNAAFAALIALSEDELVGLPLMDVIHAESQGEVKALLKQLAKKRNESHHQELTCKLSGTEGQPVEVDVTLTTSLVDGEQLVEMLIRAEQATTAASVADASAGTIPIPAASDGILPDRCAFIQSLQARLESNPKLTIGYALLDDRQQLEQRIGYAETEHLAIGICRQLRELCGDDVDVARFGPYSFAMALNEPLDAARARLDGVREQIANRLIVTPAHETSVTLSIAVATPLPDMPVDNRIATVIAAAQGMSEKGGNSVAIARLALAGEGDAGDADVAALEMIKSALDANRIKLAYQLIASLEGDTRHHFDVLVRLTDEEGREHQAASFVPIAERHGLMKEVDRRVVLYTFDAIAKRKAARDNPMMFTKLSEDTIKSAEEFLAWLKAQLKGKQLVEGEICFEAQEIVLQHHIRKSKELLKALKDLGAHIAIEHFGLGNSSVQMLDHIPVTFLKFDKSFTHNFSDRETQRKMANLMDVAKQRNIKTIVSHVEDANVMARMWQMGVNFIQGYQIQEPEVVQLSGEQ